MSDTPRTDAAAIRCACSTYVVPSEFARKLERENAALRAALDAQMKYQRDLRADRDRLDWLETIDCDSPWWVHLADITKLRAAIDAAQKEAQP
jgi:hypothetical protein